MNVTKDDAIKLLSALSPSFETEEYYGSEGRRALFEAASLVLRLLVVPPNESYSVLPVTNMFYKEKIKPLKDVINFKFAKALSEYGMNKPPYVLGFHVVDPEIGRYSQIWIPPSRKCPEPNNTDNTSWWKAYPTLWFRVYKQLLHPSTSLINAYERELLLFPGRQLVYWSTHKEGLGIDILRVFTKCDY